MIAIFYASLYGGSSKKSPAIYFNCEMLSFGKKGFIKYQKKEKAIKTCFGKTEICNLIGRKNACLLYVIFAAFLVYVLLMGVGIVLYPRVSLKKKMRNTVISFHSKILNVFGALQ